MAFGSDFEAGSPANAWVSVRGWYAHFPKLNTSSFVADPNWLKGRSLRRVMWRNPECLCVLKRSARGQRSRICERDSRFVRNSYDGVVLLSERMGKT